MFYRIYTGTSTTNICFVWKCSCGIFPNSWHNEGLWRGWLSGSNGFNLSSQQEVGSHGATIWASQPCNDSHVFHWSVHFPWSSAGCESSSLHLTHCHGIPCAFQQWSLIMMCPALESDSHVVFVSFIHEMMNGMIELQWICKFLELKPQTSELVQRICCLGGWTCLTPSTLICFHTSRDGSRARNEQIYIPPGFQQACSVGRYNRIIKAAGLEICPRGVASFCSAKKHRIA